MLAQELVNALERSGTASPPFTALSIDDLDITRGDEVMRIIADLRPATVVNAAAYTDVDGCETHEAEATAVNVDGAAHLALACRAQGCRLIHVSTDFVFDGAKRTPYRPDDPVRPLCVYGRTKADGEQRIRAIHADHLIVRTSWLFSGYGRNFVKTILRLCAEREELRVVDDQLGSPTYARDLAGALVALAGSDLTGTHHYCNAGTCSWHAFASAIAEMSGATVRVIPIRSAELSRPARRPAYSVLDCESSSKELGARPRAWQDALADCLAVLGALAPDAV